MLGILLNRRYRIIQVLGSGGFGQTYVAEDIQQPDNPKCVVKQFKPARQDQDFLHIARRLFSTEVATLRKLGSHDQIPSLVDDFEEDHEFYLVQEYVEGQPLSKELDSVQRLDEPGVMDLLRDVLHVLEFVHHNQVIHRDIKPGNLIRRQRDGKFVLIDFGAVKEIQTQMMGEPGETNLTIGIGTHGYGPSEQLMGKPRYNSDLYALGMTAIEALTGLQPYQLPTHPNTDEVLWQKRIKISPKLKTILSQMTRYHFNQRYQSAREVLEALEMPADAFLSQPTEMITEGLTDSTQLPPTMLAPPEYVPSRVPAAGERGEQFQPRALLASLVIGIASFTVTGLILGMRQLGWLQPLELATFDRMTQISPDPGPDPRLLVVGITDRDIQTQKQFPLSDRTVAQTLRVLKSYQPRVIGLDLLRDIPQEPGNAALRTELAAPNLVTITQMGSAQVPATPPPLGIPFNRVGFNDLVLDQDGVVRRNLMFADNQTTTLYSFSLRLALAYLAAEGMKPQPNRANPDVLQLGKGTFQPLDSHTGAYQAIDARGYQILLKYRSRTPARQVSLGDVLSGQVKPEWVKDKVVLIGTTAVSGKDLSFTPFSSAEQETPRIAGVLIHANSVSQILEAAFNGRSLFWYWSDWAEAVWIAGWAIAGSTVAWCIRRPLVLAISGTALLLVLGAVCFGIFTQMGWVPGAAPAVAAIAAGGAVIAYRAYRI
ncbi:CHASE2 domain-containing protein [Kovacikia minuta CCNUW1]|uniref:CHASE2 domain-containing protein n=1 Tax=Kovacikia minuta TaxID=2931930 RepID=UPI001CCD6806|nr:CHASE2 domain-containing protein [Kovacikia minuta]UBF26620.1 CHASE2 domain-containing protein [Kovacikia minuta CCNUW1]